MMVPACRQTARIAVATVLILMTFASRTALAQSEQSVVPLPFQVQPCTSEPCGLGGPVIRHLDQEPMSKEARAFVRTKLLPAVSRRIAASEYFRRKKAEKHCQVTYAIRIAPSKAVSIYNHNLQQTDDMFFEEARAIVQETVMAWKGAFPEDVFDKLFMMRIGFGILPCQPMRPIAK